MKVRHYQHVHQLTFSAPFLPVNVQLFEHDLGVVLIDTALERNAQDILDYIESIGKPLLAILLTHVHVDHTGGVDIIKRAHPQAELFVSRRDARLLEGDETMEEGERRLKVKGSIPAISSKPDALLDPGDHVFGLYVHSAAGHTPGSIAFFDTTNRFLFAGDAFQSHGGAAVAGDMRPLFPFPAMATWDKDAAVDNAERLVDLAPLVTFVGHGNRLKGTHRLYLALKRARRKRARKHV